MKEKIVAVSDDVPVVGAGPVGLTCASHLARLGVSARVVEKLERPTTESRAVGVHARSMEMPAALGVMPASEARGRRIGAVEMVDGATGATRVRMDLADTRTGDAITLSNLRWLTTFEVHHGQVA